MPSSVSQELGPIDVLEVSTKLANALIGACPTTTIMINGTPMLGVLDTGSQVTIMTEDCFLETFRGIQLEQLKWLSINAANNLQIPYNGYFEADIQLGGIEIPGRGILVVKVRREIPMLIGMNILENLDQDTFVNHFCLKAPPKSSQVVEGLVRIPRTAAVVVPAQSCKVVVASCPRQHSDVEEVAEAVEQLPKGILVRPTLTKIHDGQIILPVINVTKDDIYLNPRMPLAKLQCVASIADDRVSYESINVTVNNVMLHEKLELIVPHWPSLNPEQQIQAAEMFESYQDVFAVDDDDLGFTDMITHQIRLTDEKPVKQAFRRIPPSQFEEVREHIRKLLERQVIRESSSPFASPTVLVCKPDGSLRLCVGYRQLNSKTIKDAYPIPRIDESLDALHGAQWFSTIDLLSGYHQVAIADDDKHETSFITPFGLYEYNRMPFGLCNAPGTFQRLVQCCLGDQFFQTLLCYLDDILVFSKTFEDHVNNLFLVFQRLRKFGLKIKIQKCAFFQREVKYLGLCVTKSGVKADPGKIEVVRD